MQLNPLCFHATLHSEKVVDISLVICGGTEHVVDLRRQYYNGVSFAQHMHTVVPLELCEPTNFYEVPSEHSLRSVCRFQAEVNNDFGLAYSPYPRGLFHKQLVVGS